MPLHGFGVVNSKDFLIVKQSEEHAMRPRSASKSIFIDSFSSTDLELLNI
jgi:hypothetical protein